MREYPINVNDDVKVRLTARGRKAVEDHWHAAYSRLPGIQPPYTPRDWRTPDKDGYVKVQLWDLMAVLGPHMRLGADPLTEGNLVVIDTAAP